MLVRLRMTPQEADALFLEVVGGWDKKGRVYGLGSGAHTLYDKPSRSTVATNGGSTSYTPSVVSQLQTQLQTTQTDLQKTQQELEEQRRLVEEHRQLLIEVQSQMKNLSTAMRHPSSA